MADKFPRVDSSWGIYLVVSGFPSSPVCGLGLRVAYRHQLSLSPVSFGGVFIHLYPKWDFSGHLQRRAARMLW